MAMPAALDRYYTREEVLAIPDDGNRYELVHGELLVSPAPRALHQRAVFSIARTLHDYVHVHRMGEVLIAPADIAFGRPEAVLVQPDVFVVGPEHLGQEWEDIRQLRLVVEVLSPSTVRYDRFTKRRLYQEVQVPVYWIIDPEQQRAEVWTPDANTPRYEAERLVWHPDPSTEPLTVVLSSLFAP
ncbi:MAG: Uma2 family endonuclease [Gemmatimonadaceae bacterium]